MTPEEEVAAERRALLELVRTQARLGFPLPSIELMAGPLDEEAVKVFNEAAEQPGDGRLIVDTTPVYEWRDIWAEESGGLANNSAQWSYGNGATGFIGLPIDSGWEVTAMYFQADTGNAATDLTLELCDYTTPSTAAPVIASLDVSVAAGHGGVNNVYRYLEFAAPLPVPAGALLGFRTQERGGNASDARVGARLRRLQAEVVTGVRLI